MPPRKPIPESARHRFGGDWTEQKLAILREYLDRYHVALKNQKFEKLYIDAFAGTGYVERKPSARPDKEPLFEALEAAPEADDDGLAKAFVAGSARVALECGQAFDRYIFIEKDPTRGLALANLKEAFPERADRISVQITEANEEIQRLCQEGNWRNRRAVLFLDPYGTQVQWKTIEAVARTKAIDLWLLFPIGMGVNRMVTRSGDISEPWKRRLNELFGTEDWYETFYRVEHQSMLPGLGDPVELRVKASIEAMSEYFLKRLQTCFAGVAPKPVVLRNSTRSPLYLLCFAAANPVGAPIAVRMANAILKKMAS